MEYEKNRYHPSRAGSTMVRVGILVGVLASIIVIARLITGRKKHAS